MGDFRMSIKGAVFLSDANLNAVEYVPIEEYKRIVARCDRLQKELQHLARHVSTPPIQVDPIILAQRDRLREAVNTALMHMIGYVNPTDAERELIAVLRKAVLQEDRDEI